MKLMFASDLHGSLTATDKVLEIFARSGAQWLILLGDLLNHGPRNALPEGYQPAQVAERLNAYADRIIAVRGNCDSEVDQMLLSFPMMAPWQQVILPERRLFLTHGHLYHPAERPPLRSGDVLVYGHTHLPQAQWQGDIICFNPGSVTLPKGGNVASYGMLSNGDLQVLALQQDKSLARVTLAN
ncbi:phosphodiesterase [Yersinia ruckeri]|uniref:Phosphoesterase n=1 Tax=Yersinia ruckeri TaxID=29486 RepID=A0A0A8VIS5_YERRU|nr:phosphodiesterase [Yersinia ruckeri]KGA51495.1 phosphodiesterase yfcE [Yersinia ruckeri ATCC 29473]MCK8594365.1 phosphodiesterase [Yersinia ruckeri]MCK8598617.1 phosphodiesterase [Yersinia ruckeri]MCW6611368.1 phosphodiesterase [Yersinia ruckeri]MCW6617672.1 phosphodiesterase [Yersinia ruckeri]